MSKVHLSHLNEGEIFFTGRHPDTRTNKKWVADMNKKFPELNWGVKKRDRKKEK
jgi:hypothetical protein